MSPQNHKFEVRPKKTTQPFTFILFCPTIGFWGPNPRQAVAVSSGAYFLAGCCICCDYGVQGISRVTLDFPSRIADCWYFLSCHQTVDLARSSFEGGTACWHHLLGLFESIWMQPMPLQQCWHVFWIISARRLSVVDWYDLDSIHWWNWQGIYIYRWVFPKIMVPPNHPFQ